MISRVKLWFWGNCEKAINKQRSHLGHTTCSRPVPSILIQNVTLPLCAETNRGPMCVGVIWKFKRSLVLLQHLVSMGSVNSRSGWSSSTPSSFRLSKAVMNLLLLSQPSPTAANPNSATGETRFLSVRPSFFPCFCHS